MEKLISRKESKRYPGLFVKKYVRKVFYDALWNKDPDLLEARGHVEDAEGNIVIRPFTKIFNRFENNTDIHRGEPCVYTRKVNGFMAAVTYVPQVDDVVISTTGSLDSDFVEMAREFMPKKFMNYVQEHQLPTTYLFEIVHPNDPHIIPETFGAYLLGWRRVDEDAPYFSTQQNEVLLDSFAYNLGLMRPQWGVANFDEIVRQAKTCYHEGFVVYGQASRTALKIKSPYYLSLKAAARCKDIMKLNKKRVDEEFYPLIDHLTLMGEQFTMMNEQERLTYIRSFLNGTA